MRLTYFISDKKVQTESSNSDVSFIEKKEGNHYYLAIEAKHDIVLSKAVKTIKFKVNSTDKYFLNGYQSWTDTHLAKSSFVENSFKRHSHLVRKVFPLDRYGDSVFYKYHVNRLHSFDIFYSIGKEEIFILSNNYENAYLIIELQKSRNHLVLISDVENRLVKEGETFIIFDYMMTRDYREGMDLFEQKYPIKNIEKVFGYTSWYNYYQNINEEIILRDLSSLDNRFNLFQIDDGYETFVGDWLDIDEKKFPNGLKPIVDEIHSRGFKAGIWLAPFVAEQKSKLFKEHPEFFRLDKKHKPIKVGVNWSGQYVLDIEKKEVVEYIQKCLKFYIDLGFDFFKLDFLYAVNVPKDYKHTRAEISQKGYELLRDTLKGKSILGCGATLFNCIDNFDYLRIGPDMTLDFDDVMYMRLMHRERPSTKTTIQNTLYRSLFNHRLFANDPDVFLLRDENTKLPIQTRKALAYINALFGSVLMTSDNIADYKEHQNKILDHVLDIYQNAKDISYEVKNNKAYIKYSLNGVNHQFTYHINNGKLTDEK